ncbi:MAG TPA: prohibitin family protein [Cyclobacteriaceae bacterium]|nr:prohibitin family protein [Cyclobacteriaceae bacterium]
MRVIVYIVSMMLLSSCVVVRQGEVGVKRKLGKLEDKSRGPGMYTFNPFTATVLKTTVQTENMEVRLRLPSKEGLTINSEISILYSIQKHKVPEIFTEIGIDYERTALMPVFRSAAADVTSNFMAKDMHSGQRAVIEERIKNRMEEVLGSRGFVIEQVLLKSIELPAELSRAIERKLEAEQESERMQYVLMRERQEAERRKIEAEGTRDAQQILSQGLSKEIIELRSIEAFRELAISPNTKIVITDGKTPYLIQPKD